MLLRGGQRLSFCSFCVAIAVHIPVQRSEVVERRRQDGPVGGGVLRRQLALDAGGLLQGGLGVGEAVRVVVESPQVVERACQVGPVGGGVLRRQLAPDAGGLLEGGLGVGEAVRVPVENAQVVERVCKKASVHYRDTDIRHLGT
jgi:hypothetical protein